MLERSRKRYWRLFWPTKSNMRPIELETEAEMTCLESKAEHMDHDFDGKGLSTTGCDCTNPDMVEDLDLTPTEDGPEGEESYEEPEGSDD